LDLIITLGKSTLITSKGSQKMKKSVSELNLGNYNRKSKTRIEMKGNFD